MLLECRQFDEIHAEFERWLLQVEDELEKNPVDPRAQDVDQQIAQQQVGTVTMSTCQQGTPP